MKLVPLTTLWKDGKPLTQAARFGVKHWMDLVNDNRI